MSGIRVEVDVNHREIQDAMARLVARATALRPAMEDAGQYLVRATRSRFDQERDPQGVPWAPLSPEYRKRKKGGKILQATRKLRNIAHQTTDTSVAVGTNRIYGAIHQLGGTIRQKSRSQLIRFNKRGKFMSAAKAAKAKRQVKTVQATIGKRLVRIPARPYLGINRQDQDRLIRILSRHLAGD